MEKIESRSPVFLKEENKLNADRRATQALILWGVFIILNILIHGTIPFALGKDVQVWTASPVRALLFNVIQYGLIFLVVPLILTKGWVTVRQPAFLIPLVFALFAMALRTDFRSAAAIVLFVLAWLHFRFDLSDLGFHSRGWRGDVIAVLLITSLLFLQRLFQRGPFSIHFASALAAGIDRFLFNPASTVENLFYFGFLAERLSAKLGRFWTPVLIGTMYGFHEMTNPEYWYEGRFFPFIFIGVALFTVIYLWRRNVIAIWVGDGLGRFVSRLF